MTYLNSPSSRDPAAFISPEAGDQIIRSQGVSMNRISLRKTRSLSPLSFEEVDAEIVCEDGKVFLEKRDEQGKTYTSLVESNIDFYKLITSNHVPGQYEARQLFLYTSSKCNLKCPVCYEEFDVTSEISVEQIKQILKGVKNKRVVLTGRESTCRPDIFEVIRVVAENNRAVLLTNGVKLADYDFVFRLKEVGLDSVIFSFDGFDDDVYRQMNGAALLKTKLKAFDNQAGRHQNVSIIDAGQWYKR